MMPFGRRSITVRCGDEILLNHRNPVFEPCSLYVELRPVLLSLPDAVITDTVPHIVVALSHKIIFFITIILVLLGILM